MTLASKHIPNKTIRVRNSDPSWLSNSIKRLMRKRKRLFDKYKKSKSLLDFENYKHVRNKITNEIRKSKKTEVDNLAKKLEDNNISPKDWWKTLKYYIKPDKPSSIPPLNKDGTIYLSAEEKANVLNNFFTEQTHLDETNASLPTATVTPLDTINTIITTPQEVESVLKSLPIGKATGPDLINNRLLKELAESLSLPLCELFNFSLAKGKFPSIWKQANVTPVFKKNDPSCPSNYRPISLLSAAGKVLEKIVFKYLLNFFRDHQVITTLQSGFIPGDSTVNQLVDIYNTFCKALDEGKEVRAVFCDISKAFDRVWHKGLLYKLKYVGVTDSLLHWCSDYLANRKQRVVIPGACSDWLPVTAGVPQGSILGPLLFLLYINDIVDNIKATIRLFADDTSLYIIVDNPHNTAGQLNTDLQMIHQWATQWLVTFNPTKSESIIFSRKLNKPNHPPIFMNNQPINEVHTHKHLGVFLSSDCQWHDHLAYIKSKAWSRINVMRKFKFKLDRKSLQTMYFSFIRPLLEYADVVWDNCTQYEVNELEKMQNEAARVVTGATKLVSINSLYLETGWEPLASRRKKHKLLVFYNMVNNLSPNYLSSLVPSTVGNTTTYQLRNAANLHTIRANSQLYYNSFLPSVIRDWNELPDNVRNSPSKMVFKRHLNSNITNPPNFFFVGKRLGQIHHARLRTKCSSLCEHLYSKNILDNPLCVCGAIEDTTHFLLKCNRFSNQRQEMLDTVTHIHTPTLNVLLYGSQELNEMQNQQIFTAAEFYLKI